VLRVDLRRPTKHNAINDAMIARLNDIWSEMPSGVRAVLLTAQGQSFCSGLDLSEQAARSPFEAVHHSRSWHACFRRMEKRGIPIVAALKGPVIGGGLELALVAHVRVACASTYYALPETKHGFFVGGGASVRASRVLGASRMQEMMLTCRAFAANEGQQLGLSHYLVDKGTSEERALELARKVASNTPETNFAITVGLPHIADMSADDGFFAEALMEGVIQSSPGLSDGLAGFLSGRQKTKLGE
jgi:(methylthio)acryloyl-CoA hydratase